MPNHNKITRNYLKSHEIPTNSPRKPLKANEIALNSHKSGEIATKNTQGRESVSKNALPTLEMATRWQFGETENRIGEALFSKENGPTVLSLSVLTGCPKTG